MLKVIVMAGALVVSTAAMAQMRPGFGDLMENADANKDGMIDKDEFKAARAAQFQRLDRNADGFLDSQDRPQRPAQGQEEGAQKERQPGEHRSGERAAKMLAQADANGDGKVSKDEYVNAPTTFFDQADTDHDGVLSAKELDTAKAAARARFSEHRKRQ